MDAKLELLDTSDRTSEDGGSPTTHETQLDDVESNTEVKDGLNCSDTINLIPSQTESISNHDAIDGSPDVALLPEPHSTHAKVHERWWTTLLAVLVSSLLAVLFGCSLGFPSPVLLELSELPDSELRFDVLLSDIFSVSRSTERVLTAQFQLLCCVENISVSTDVVRMPIHVCMYICAALFSNPMVNLLSPSHPLQGSGLVGGLFGGPPAGWVADRWGRKIALILNSVPYLVGYLMISAAYLITNGVVFKSVLIVGRFITGFGMGWSFLAVSVSESESLFVIYVHSTNEVCVTLSCYI